MTHSSGHEDASRSEPPAVPRKRRWPRLLVRFVAVLALIAIVGMALKVGAWVLDCREAKQQLETMLVDLRAKGEPVSKEDLERSFVCDLPDERNMAIRLAPAAKRFMEYEASAEARKLLPGTCSTDPLATGERWPSDRMAAASDYLRRFEPELSDIHEALQLERGCTRVHWSTPMFQANMPDSSELRSVSKALVIEVLFAAQQGDRERAAAIIRDASRIERAIDDNPTMIGQLVRLALRASFMDCAAETVNLCDLSERDLAEIDAQLRQEDVAAQYKRGLLVERVVYLEDLNWAMSGGDQGGIVRIASRFVPEFASEILVRELKVYNKLLDAIDGPNRRALAAFDLAIQEAEKLPRRCLMLKMLLPSLKQSCVMSMRCVSLQRALRVALAAERFRLTTGRWPDDASALVPDYLDAVPVDPFDEQPIRFQRTDRGVKAWCIGDDRVDNGGDIKRFERLSSCEKPPDWGWIMLNPDQRNRPRPQAPSSAPAPLQEER